MTTKGQGASPARPPRPEGRPPAGLWQTLPLTREERLQRIEAMGQRIHGYIQFMGQIGSLNGTSAEAKERAVAAFYECLAVLEGRLSRIHEDLQLG